MNTRIEAWRIAGKLLRRSRCRFKVGAVLTDAKGRVFAWGWNHAGATGRGVCAERHALSRANPERLRGATIHIRAFNGVNESPSTPCRACHSALTRAGVNRVEFASPGTKTRTRTAMNAIARVSQAYILRKRHPDEESEGQALAA